MVKQLGADVWNAIRPVEAAPVFPPRPGGSTDPDDDGPIAAKSPAVPDPAPVLTPVRELVFRLKLRLARV